MRLSPAFLPLLVVAACGGGGATVAHPDLMARTTAGQNRCSVAKSHDRPFVIEWDATDLASFEGKAAKDLVFVRYEGCEMEVLDGCIDDGHATYAPAVTTSGNVEGFDIHDEEELYAKLPLGAAALAARVESGETLHLRYLVNGVATAPIAAIYRSDVDANPRCAKATHYVASYALGAFELTTSEHDAVGGGASLGPAAAGGGKTHEGARLKRSGDLAACRDASATASLDCRVPIRLTLAPITEGARPPNAPPASGGGAEAAASPVGDPAALRQSAADELRAGDGQACLRDLDRAAQLDPRGDRAVMAVRASCEMRSGQCELGRRRYREALEAQGMLASLGAAMVDRAVEQAAAENCPARQLDAGAQVTKAATAVTQAAVARDFATCATAAGTLVSLRGGMSPEQRQTASGAVMAAATFAGQAKACDAARALVDAWLALADPPVTDAAAKGARYAAIGCAP